MATHFKTLSRILGDISHSDARRASTARLEAELGIAVALLLLVVVFGVFYFRSLRLFRENRLLLQISQQEATTDRLTGLGNRRALEIALARAVSTEPEDDEFLLAIFDLDGFKQFNDSYGHAAGDSLLQRLGARLAAAAKPTGRAFRMGGDEFCLLSRCSETTAGDFLAAVAEALTDTASGSRVGCSYGAAWIPSEAATDTEALRLADERMYVHKPGQASAALGAAEIKSAGRDSPLATIIEAGGAAPA
jgi:two-component system cell cycle response regulator